MTVGRARAAGLAIAVVAAAMTFGLAAPAVASTGELDFADCITGETQSGPAPGGSGACEQVASATSGQNSGLAGQILLEVAVSAGGSGENSFNQCE